MMEPIKLVTGAEIDSAAKAGGRAFQAPGTLLVRQLAPSCGASTFCALLCQDALNQNRDAIVLCPLSDSHPNQTAPS